MTLKYLPQIFADKSADKIADLVFQSFTSIEIKTIWYNFVEPYLRIYLRLICGICGRKFSAKDFPQITSIPQILGRIEAENTIAEISNCFSYTFPATKKSTIKNFGTRIGIAPETIKIQFYEKGNLYSTHPDSCNNICSACARICIKSAHDR